MQGEFWFFVLFALDVPLFGSIGKPQATLLNSKTVNYLFKLFAEAFG